jgi:hypothetical protein
MKGYTGKELAVNRSRIIIRNRKNILADRCGKVSGQKCHEKGSRKEITNEI